MLHAGSSVRRKDVVSKENDTDSAIKIISEKHTVENNTEECQDDKEINRVMNKFENLKNEDPEFFQEIMHINKEIIETCSKEKSSRDDIKMLEEHYKDLEEIDEDLLFWCSHKSIIKAVIENKNIDVSHFMIVKKGYKLYNKQIYKNFIQDYFKSLSHVDFLTCEEEEMSKYMAILEFLIAYGKVGLNEPDDNLRNTPLHFAVLFKQIQFIVMIIGQTECEINKRNKYDDTPLDFAIESFRRGEDELINQEIIELLMQHGAEAYTQEDYFRIEDQNK